MKLSVARDYSELTGMRYCRLSDHSGEDFYHTFLNAKFTEAYRNDETVELDIDGTRDGVGPSFLDESIGNLVYDFSLEVVQNRLKVISVDQPHWLAMIKEETYPNWEDRRLHLLEAKITEPHEAWYRLKNGQLIKDVWIKKIS